jgi:hypothetical protein
MDLGSANWGNPAAALGQGVDQGASMALTLNNAIQQKRQMEWEKDYHMMEAGFKFAEAKGVSPESSAKVLNESVAPLWNKYNPNHPFPALTPQTVDGFLPIVSNGINLYTKASKGEMPYSSALAELQQQMSLYNTKTAAAKDVSDKQKAAFDEVTAPLKAGADMETKAKEEKLKASGEMTPEKALARISDLERQNADIQKIDQQNVLMMQLMGDKGGDVSKFKVDAAALAARKAAVANEMIQLNTHLPKEQQRIVVSSADLPAIQGKLAARGVKNPDEFIAANYIVRPSSVGPQQAPEVPPQQ